MSSHPAVVRYIGDGKPWDDQRARVVAGIVQQHWDTHGFGWRVIELAPEVTGVAVGLACLNFLGDGAAAGVAADELEVGWWLWPARWGQGYASEAAEAIRDEAFAHLGAPSVVGRIQPENAASRAVAERIGMYEERTTTGRFGEKILLYRATVGGSQAVP